MDNFLQILIIDTGEGENLIWGTWAPIQYKDVVLPV